MELLDLFQKRKQTWNADECRFQRKHSPVKVLARKGLFLHLKKWWIGFNVGTCSAAGKSMPSMIVVKGNSALCLTAWYVVGAPKYTIWTYQESAWMEDTLGLTWCNDIVLPRWGMPDNNVWCWMAMAAMRAWGCSCGGHSHYCFAFSHYLQYSAARCVSLWTVAECYEQTIFQSYFTEYYFKYAIDKQSWPRLFAESYCGTVTDKNIFGSFRKKSDIHL